MNQLLMFIFAFLCGEQTNKTNEWLVWVPAFVEPPTTTCNQWITCLDLFVCLDLFISARWDWLGRGPPVGIRYYPLAMLDAAYYNQACYLQITIQIHVGTWGRIGQPSCA
jgi:hypothetical protein